MNVLLAVHVAGATVGLFAGVAALVARKGSLLHRRSGKVFVGAMLTMCASAVVLAIFKTQPLNVVAGVVTAYLVASALTTVQPPSAGIRTIDRGLMLIACTAGTSALALAVFGDAAERVPYAMFGLAGALGSIGDFKALRAGRLARTPRLTRHLWRMSLALTVAMASFFLGPRGRVRAVLPDALVRTDLLMIPVLAVLVTMFYWLWRVRRDGRQVGVRDGRRISRDRHSRAAVAEAYSAPDCQGPVIANVIPGS